MPTNLTILNSWDGFEGDQDGGFRIHRLDVAGELDFSYRLTVERPGLPALATEYIGSFDDGVGVFDIPVAATDDGVYTGPTNVTFQFPGQLGGEWLPADEIFGGITIHDNESGWQVWVESKQDAIEGVEPGFIRLKRNVTFGPIDVG